MKRGERAVLFRFCDTVIPHVPILPCSHSHSLMFPFSHVRIPIPPCSHSPRLQLEVEAERLMKVSGDMESERLQDIYERLDELDASSAETKAARLLHGLGGLSLSLSLALSLARTHTYTYCIYNVCMYIQYFERKGERVCVFVSPCLPQPTLC